MNYFIIENNQQVGPLTLEQLVARNITSDTLVWKEGMEDWQPAWKVDELHTVLDQIRANAEQAAQSQQNCQVTPPEYQAQGNYGYETQGGNPNTPHPERDMLTPTKPKSYLVWKILGGLFIFMLIVMMLSNPKKDQHINSIRTEVSKAIDKGTGNGNDIFSQGFKMIARMMAGNVIDSALDQLFEYHNYLLFSKGTVTLNDKEHTVSYGIFGKVITMNADDLLKAMEKDDDVKIEESSNTVTSSDNDTDSESTDDVNDNAEESTDAKSQINKMIDKAGGKVQQKVEEKINKKMEEVASDSTTIEKLIDKILDLF